MTTRETWLEWDAAAEYCARHAYRGRRDVPEGFSQAVYKEIERDPRAFEDRVREHAR